VPKVLFKASDWGNDYSETDPRTNREALEEDAQIIPYDAGFSEAELRHLGVGDIDFELYLRTKELVAKNWSHLRKPSGSEVVDAEERHHLMLEAITAHHGGRPHVRISAEKMERVKAGVDWANEIDAQCNAVMDIARSQIYQALATGKILAQGWREEPEIAGNSQLPLVTIPANHWSLRDFDWEESELNHSSGSYYAVQIPTADMLTIFPRPNGVAEPKLVDSFPGCLLVDDDGTMKRPSVLHRPRGRPSKGDGLIKLAVVNIFSDKARRGELPDKAEALVQDIIEYVALAFDETISRSTAQKYSKMLPENSAGK
jgi:hypothetical protein